MSGGGPIASVKKFVRSPKRIVAAALTAGGSEIIRGGAKETGRQLRKQAEKKIPKLGQTPELPKFEKGEQLPENVQAARRRIGRRRGRQSTILTDLGGNEDVLTRGRSLLGV